MENGVSAIGLPDVDARDEATDPPPTRSRWREAVPPLVTLGVILGSWELAAQQEWGAIGVPRIGEAVSASIEMAQSADLWRAAGESAYIFSVGLLLGIVAAVVVGLVLGSYRQLDVAFTPFIFAAFTTPFVAVIPLVLLVLGYREAGKIGIVFFLTAIVTTLQTIEGVRSVSNEYLEVASTFRAPRWRRTVEIVLPGAAPFIVAGVRLAIGRALVGIVVAEFETVDAGLGGLIRGLAQSYRLDAVIFPIFLYVATGITLTALVSRAERRLRAWRVEA
jgi:NitT/TauT family transport system permease protein